MITSLLPGALKSPDPVLAPVDKDLAKGRVKKAFAAVKSLAERGNPAAQLRLARMYQSGEGIVQNLSAALKWFRASAEQDNLEAQNELGLIYLAGRVGHHSASTAALAQLQEPGQGGSLFQSIFPDGFTIKQDYPEAVRWSQRAAASGHAIAQARLGYHYAAGIGVERDYAMAEHWLGEAAKQDEELGILCLAILYAGGHGDPPKFELAAEHFGRLAERGNPAGEYNLALLALAGNGVPADPERAEALLKSAADREHLPAIHLLGVRLAERDGDPESLRSAETWLRRAAGRGSAASLVALGRLFASGKSGSLPEAAALIREAADLRHAEAHHCLAELYRDGRGLPRDAEEAAKWFRSAVELGFLHSTVDLMVLHARGVERARDLGEVADRLSQAIERGDTTACHYLGVLLLRGIGVPRDSKRGVDLLVRSWEAGHRISGAQLGTYYASEDADAAPDYARAAEWYAKAGEAGDVASHFNLAFLHIRGLGVALDPDRGVALLTKLADGGFRLAAEALFSQYSPGGYLPPDQALAAHWLNRAVELGSTTAARQLARRQFEGDGADREAARRLLERAAESGDVQAQVELGRFLQFGADGEAPDMAAAQVWMERAALGGSAEAMAWLGDVHRQSLSPTARPEVAEQYYRMAGQRGHVGAITMLAALRSAPEAGEAGLEEAARLWRLAADAGNANAKRRLGECLLHGIGLPKDIAGGLALLEETAGAGDVAAQLALGAFHAEGKAPQADVTKAPGWFRKAAEAGNAAGEYNLGVCHRLGLGLPKDDAEARRWYELAAAQDFPSARLALADMLVQRGDGSEDARAAELYAGLTDIYPHAWYGLGLLRASGRGLPLDRKIAIECFRRSAEQGFQPAIDTLKNLEPARADA